MTKCTHIYNISHDFCYLWKTEELSCLMLDFLANEELIMIKA